MQAWKHRVNIVIMTSVTALVALGCLMAYFYHEFRTLFVSKPPKVLLAQAEGQQCRPEADKSQNPNKLLFVSCSGFYDEE